MRKRSRKLLERQEEGTVDSAPPGKVQADFVMESFGNISRTQVVRSTSSIGSGKGTPRSIAPHGSWSSSITANKAWSRMNSDFKDLLRIINEHKVRYLVVGGYALIKYTEPRYTKDLDVWVEASPKNAHAVVAALREFGAPLTNITPADFAKEGSIYARAGRS